MFIARKASADYRQNSDDTRSIIYMTARGGLYLITAIIMPIHQTVKHLHK